MNTAWAARSKCISLPRDMIFSTLATRGQERCNSQPAHSCGLRKVPFQSCAALCPSAARREGDRGAPSLLHVSSLSSESQKVTKVSSEPPVLQAEQAQLCHPSQGAVFQLIFLVSSEIAPTGPQLSCAEGSRDGHTTPGGVSHSVTTKFLSEMCANPELQQSSLS